MRKTAPLTALPEPFVLTEKTIETAIREHPTIDLEATKTKFERKADSLGWMYRSWQSAFLNYLDNCEKYGGAVYKLGREQDPKWKAILAEVAPYGFRAPYQHDTPGSYRTDFELWKSREKRSTNIAQFGDVLKRMA